MNIDNTYITLLSHIEGAGESITTRGHDCKKVFAYPFIIKSEDTALLNIRKVAWKTALREFEWFVSGQPKLPEHKTLAKWWAGQMNKDGEYPYGYGENMRSFNLLDSINIRGIDQLQQLLKGLKEHPNSRRHVMTLWNPAQAEYISDGGYTKMPTTCHGSHLQFSVSSNKLTSKRYLHMIHHQRSADVMLGLPHNLVQYKAFLMYLAYYTNCSVGNITYMLGDAHIYDQHLYYLDKMFDMYDNATGRITEEPLPEAPQLIYTPTGGIDRWNVPVFKASDFSLGGEYKPSLTDSLPLIV